MPCANAFATFTILGLTLTLGPAITTASSVGEVPPVSGDAAVTSLLADVLAAPSGDSLRSWHDLLGGRPHVAGTAGDRVVISAIAGAFEGMGLDTEVWWFEPLLARPVAASLTIVDPSVASDDVPETAAPADQPRRRRRGVMPLPITEDELLADPSTRHPDLSWGWNAYSASGIVEAGVVYANRGTAEDFARLRALGVDCTGRIVLARYGGNYRGFKAKFAEEAGAAGLVVYTDPGDSGDDKGPVWPEGGWANATCIQRGSMLTLPYKGDPLTPGRPALPGEPRRPIEEVGLPTIPIQPIGYAAATRIMAAMTGPTLSEVAADDALASWAGGLDVRYRIDGGDLRLRLEVEQVREPMPTANVLATLRGSERPDEFVVVGCHHDAWGFGAADPLAGTIVLMEAAKAFADAAERGFRPRRSVVFAAWGAEEFGIIGSSEWVEANRDRLRDRAVAYLNLDMAAMGTNFGAGATPSLAAAVVEAAGLVPQPRDPAAGTGETLVAGTVAEAWAGERGAAACGDLGGGSDHVGFLCHAGVPCVTLHAGGSRGTSYHSNYDTLAWYRSTVGDDYAGALMLARITSALAASLADRPLHPVDPTATVSGLPGRLDRLEAEAIEAGLAMDATALRAAVAEAETACLAATDRLAKIDATSASATVDRANRDLRALDRVWLEEAGLSGRPWFANTFAASDRDSGYGAAVLPLLSEAIRDRDQAALDDAVRRYRATVTRLAAIADRLGR